MDVIGSSKSGSEVDVQALAVAVFKDEKATSGILKELDAATGGMISDAISSEEFNGKQGDTAYFHVAHKGVKARRILLIGCGDQAAYKAAQVTQMAGAATRLLRAKNVKTMAIVPRAEGEAEKVAQTAAVGAVMGLFEPDKYRTKEKEQREIKSAAIVIEGADKKAVERGAERGRIIGESTNFTRDLANEPGAW
ncbi:MAG TPA: M17 family peptidase N-terminal domain-containing protein, partial [Pyrinomonadaceae bacterium]|nr:M17 family peptidase N-terminal domain-containing protein [Pyrinomonadaceae bacterium]